MAIDETERLRRWRLVLGKDVHECMCSGTGKGMGEDKGEGAGEGKSGNLELSKRDLGMDRVLDALYDLQRSAGLGSSSPNVARWLGDIRTYFPSSTVRIMQQDAS